MNTISPEARSALVFFSSPIERKLEYLSNVRWPRSFVLNENGETTKVPLIAISIRFQELIEREISRHFTTITQYDRTLYHELSAIMELIIARRDDYSYMWYLDKKAAGVSGYADHLWSTVQRLALAILDALSIEHAKMEIDLRSLVPVVTAPTMSRASPRNRAKRKK